MGVHRGENSFDARINTRSRDFALLRRLPGIPVGRKSLSEGKPYHSVEFASVSRAKTARPEIRVISPAAPESAAIGLPAPAARARSPPVNVAIVEDFDIFRALLCKACTRELGLRVVAETGDGLQAVQLLRRTAPDLLLLDLGLPSLDGLSVGEQALARHPDLRIIILSANCNGYTVYCAERLGVHGFVDKNLASVEALKAAIHALRTGGSWFSQSFNQARAKRLANPRSFDKVLTEREREVLALVGVPLSDDVIAKRLGISPETIEKHRGNIRAKLGLRTGVDLIEYARETGLTPASRSDAMWNFAMGMTTHQPVKRGVRSLLRRLWR